MATLNHGSLNTALIRLLQNEPIQESEKKQIFQKLIFSIMFFLLISTIMGFVAYFVICHHNQKFIQENSEAFIGECWATRSYNWLLRSRQSYANISEEIQNLNNSLQAEKDAKHSSSIQALPSKLELLLKNQTTLKIAHEKVAPDFIKCFENHTEVYLHQFQGHMYYILMTSESIIIVLIVIGSVFIRILRRFDIGEEAQSAKGSWIIKFWLFLIVFHVLCFIGLVYLVMNFKEYQMRHLKLPTTLQPL